MEATRQIYWNVGHGAVAPMYLAAFAAAAVFGWGVWRRVQVYRLGAALPRLDAPGARLGRMARAVLGQSGVLRNPVPGASHALLFWSFLLLLAGTLLVMAQADFTEPLLGITFLRGGFYRLFSIVLDLAGLVAMAGVAALLVRRVALRGRLEGGAGDLALLAALLGL